MKKKKTLITLMLPSVAQHIDISVFFLNDTGVIPQK